MAFTTLPALRHLTQTRILCGVPSTMALTVFRLGRKRRGVMPVIFRPTPPFFLARPRRTIVLPATGFLPQIKHIFDIFLCSVFEGAILTQVTGICKKKIFRTAVECAVSSGSQGREIFSHVKISLCKSSRTLPRTFKALLTTSPHHILAAGIEKFYRSLFTYVLTRGKEVGDKVLSRYNRHRNA